MNASDVMVCDVVTVGPEESVSKAVQLLVDHDISALPVVDGERRVIGILSEADLLHREKTGTEKHRAWWLEAVTPPSVLALDYAKSHGRRVVEIMSEDVISANEDTPLSELANILERIGCAEEYQALLALAETVVGVREVSDEMMLHTDPNTDPSSKLVKLSDGKRLRCPQPSRIPACPQTGPWPGAANIRRPQVIN